MSASRAIHFFESIALENVMANTWWKRFLRPAWPSMILAGLVGIGVCVFWCSIIKPSPIIHDEFSHLLAGETFAKGRLTNPSHPHWEHFQTFGVIHQPTYMSKYPPAQGWFLAVGIWIGSPVYGMWLAFGLACAAFTWFIRVWLDEVWGLIGGLSIALQSQLATLLGCTFYGGGAPALISACLTFGAVRQLQRHDGGAKMAFVLALGIAGLAFSRAYEGAVTALSVVIPIMVVLWQLRKQFRRLVVTLVPIILVGCAAISWHLYYNFKITGDPLELPYQTYTEKYSRVPLFLFQNPTKYHLPEIPQEMREFDNHFTMRWFNMNRGIGNFTKSSLHRLQMYCHYYLGLFGSSLGAIAIACTSRSIPQPGFVWLSLALFFTALIVESFVLPHYGAPFSPLLYLCLLGSLRSLWTRFSLSPRIIVLLASVFVSGWIVEHGYNGYKNTMKPREGSPMLKRLEAEDELSRTPGNHLVFVRYKLNHDWIHEWVHNEADINKARVVWARDFGDETNVKLIRYFDDRLAWIAMPHRSSGILQRYKP